LLFEGKLVVPDVENGADDGDDVFSLIISSAGFLTRLISPPAGRDEEEQHWRNTHPDLSTVTPFSLLMRTTFKI
jgi:hypothetical protein